MKEEYMHILCYYNGFIPQMKMSGPVVHPAKVSKQTVISMLMGGLEVYEFDAATGNSLKLDLDNIKDENRMGNSPIAAAHNVDSPVVTTTSDKKEEKVTPVKVTSPEDIVFDLNDDGTVNQDTIEWNNYNSKEKKTIKSRIEKIDKKATEKSADAKEETKEDK